jgi:hypothetical protein
VAGDKNHLQIEQDLRSREAGLIERALRVPNTSKGKMGTGPGLSVTQSSRTLDRRSIVITMFQDLRIAMTIMEKGNPVSEPASMPGLTLPVSEHGNLPGRRGGSACKSHRRPRPPVNNITCGRKG